MDQEARHLVGVWAVALDGLVGSHQGGQKLPGRKAANAPFYEVPLAVHADPDSCILENRRDGIAGELSPLVRVEDLGGAMATQGLSQGIHAELGRVLESRQASTLRLAQSMMATR